MPAANAREKILWSSHDDGRRLVGTYGDMSFLVTAREVNATELPSVRPWRLFVTKEANTKTLLSTGTSDEARVAAEEYLTHADELAMMPPRSRKTYREERGTCTPWGRAQQGISYGYGVMLYSTAGHGGFHVSKTVEEAMAPNLRLYGGWYEEDVEWSILPIALPHLFTRFEVRLARETMHHFMPKKYIEIFGDIEDKHGPALTM